MKKIDAEIIFQISYISGYCQTAYPDDKNLNEKVKKLFDLAWKKYRLDKK